MDIKQATTDYEARLEGRIPLIKAGLRLKHQRMDLLTQREDP
jgi:hypothetical protein